MPANHLIAVLGIVVPCATALLVAYWHRKQMRQIELFRQNSAVGLKPPNNRLYAFVKSNRTLVIGVGGPVVTLTLEILRKGPVTRFSLFMVSLSISVALSSMTLYLFERLVHILEAQTRMAEVAVRTLEELGDAPPHHGEGGGKQ